MNIYKPLLCLCRRASEDVIMMQPLLRRGRERERGGGDGGGGGGRGGGGVDRDGQRQSHLAGRTTVQSSGKIGYFCLNEEHVT